MKRICVFCGANIGVHPEFALAAEAFGRAMAARGYDLVYGAGSVGLMGVVARTVLAAGRRVSGVIPRALTTRELAGDNIGELIVVDTMAERKERMLTLADAFVALPGGLGTMDELFESLTWGQLGIQSKPIGLLNVDGYFDGLLGWFERALGEGFIRPHHRNLLVSATDPDALLDLIEEHRPPVGLVTWESADAMPTSLAGMETE
jgi:uncharacterized protein (TIGR00730 family)